MNYLDAAATTNSLLYNLKFSTMKILEDFEDFCLALSQKSLFKGKITQPQNF